MPPRRSSRGWPRVRPVPAGPQRPANLPRLSKSSARNPPLLSSQRPQVAARAPLQPQLAAVLTTGVAGLPVDGGRSRPLSISKEGSLSLAVPDRMPRFPGAGLHRRIHPEPASALSPWRSGGPGQRHTLLLPLPSRRWGTRPSASVPAPQAPAPADPPGGHQPGRTRIAPCPVQCQPLGERRPLVACCSHPASAGGGFVERRRL
jgi:hypothetical protein